MIGKIADEPLVERSQILEQRAGWMKEQVEPRRSARIFERRRVEGHFEELFRLKYEVFDAISDAGDFALCRVRNTSPRRSSAVSMDDAMMTFDLEKDASSRTLNAPNPNRECSYMDQGRIGKFPIRSPGGSAHNVDLRAVCGPG